MSGFTTPYNGTLQVDGGGGHTTQTRVGSLECLLTRGGPWECYKSGPQCHLHVLHALFKCRRCFSFIHCVSLR